MNNINLKTEATFKSVLLKNGKKELTEKFLKKLSKSFNKNSLKSSKYLLEVFVQNQIFFFSLKTVKRSSLREIPFYLTFFKRLKLCLKNLRDSALLKSTINIEEALSGFITSDLHSVAKQSLAKTNSYNQIFFKKAFSHFRWWY